MTKPIKSLKEAETIAQKFFVGHLSSFPNKKSCSLRLKGMLELSVILFVIGVIAGYTPLIITGGILMFVSDLIDLSTGVLNPLFPMAFAFILAIIISPWYLGVFWSLAIFHMIGVYHALKKII